MGISPSLVRFLLSLKIKRWFVFTFIHLGELFVQQTVDEMLRVGGPDWQRVLNYVESIYRHFEM